MPNLANITVKKNDGTTDIVWTGVVPSAGDKTPAVWKSQTVGTADAHRPELKLSSRDNGPGSARRLDGTLSYPTTAVGTDGKINVVDKFILNISVVKPKGMPDADVNEAVSQGMNLLVSTLVKDCFKQGYAPT